MKKNRTFLIVLITNLITIVTVISLTIVKNEFFSSNKPEIKDSFYMLVEYGYFIGQKAVLVNKEYSIAYSGEDSSWIWLKSPWKDGIKPVYNPKYELKNNLFSKIKIGD